MRSLLYLKETKFYSSHFSQVVGLNFSSATTPELIMKTFDHYCEYRRTPGGIVLAPVQIGKWLILFCDEINLPDMDKYGTQRVISFLRQLVEHNGFYRNSDQQWVHLERIQFVGACNPPTDPGRKPLSHRYEKIMGNVADDKKTGGQKSFVLLMLHSLFLIH